MDNIRTYYEDWPQNSMVFAFDAIQCLFAPFGDGLLVQLVKAHSRENNETGRTNWTIKLMSLPKHV